MKNYENIVFRRFIISIYILVNFIFLLYSFSFFKHQKELENFAFTERAKISELLLKKNYDDISQVIHHIERAPLLREFLHDNSNNENLINELQRLIRSSNIKDKNYELYFSKIGYNSYISAYNIQKENELYKKLDIESFKKNFESLKTNSALLIDKSSKIIYLYKDNTKSSSNSLLWFIIIDKKRFFSDISLYDGFGAYIKRENNNYNIKGEYKEKVKEVKGFDNFLGDSFFFYVENEQMNSKVISLLLSFILPILFINLCLYYLISFSLNHLYKPIKILKNKLNIDDSDDFESIGNTYLELKNQHKFLLKKTKDFEKIYLEKQIKDFITGVSKELPKVFDDSLYSIFIIEIIDNERFESQYNQEFLLALKLKIEAQILENFSSHSFEINFLKTCFIIKNKDNFLQIGDQLKKIEDDFFINMKGFLSPSIHPQDLANAFNKTYKMCEYRDFFPKDIIIFENMINQTLNTLYYPFEIERTLIRALLSGNEKMAENIFENLFDENITIRKVDIESLKKLRNYLINTAQRVVEQKNISYNFSLLENEMQIELFRSKYIDFIKDVTIDTNRDKMCMKEKIETYIDNNFSKDISLDMMADSIGFSSAYTSKLCKELFDKNFKTMIDEKKINEAKLLLKKEPSLKIKDISIALGFNNVNSFIRLFKKYEGVSPGLYNQDAKKNI